LSGAWNFKILIDCRTRFIRTRGGGIPFALATLRPFSGNAWSIDAPTRSLFTRQIQVRGIEQRFAELAGLEAAHVLGFIPEILALCVNWGAKEE